MKKYRDLLDGKIVSVNNFTFDDGSLDHAWNTGRICYVLYADDEYEYLLPITHENKHNNTKRYFYITESDFEEFYESRYKESTLFRKNQKNSKNSSDIEGYINLSNIYKYPIVYRDEIGKISFDTYKKIRNKLLHYHHTNSFDEIINKAITK